MEISGCFRNWQLGRMDQLQQLIVIETFRVFLHLLHFLTILALHIFSSLSVQNLITLQFFE